MKRNLHLVARQLIVDIGNSSAKVAFFEENKLLEEVRIEHEALLRFFSSEATRSDISSAIVSSVVHLNKEVEQAIQQLPYPCLHMSARLKMPFDIAYKTPDTLGADRLAAAAEARAQYPDHNLLIIDVGTAITYDVVTTQGLYLGGNISPGIDMRLKALHHFTGKLPLIDKEGQRHPIGITTETAIREGVLQGVNKEIDGYIHEYKLKYPNLLVFLTGGGTFFLDNTTKSHIFADNLLVIKGLNRILMLNNEAI